MQKKSKSQHRFEQINLLTDKVIRHLPTTTHALVLLVGWRHANANRVFRKSMQELADATGLSKRHMQTIIDDLIEVGAISVDTPKKGSIPTSYVITGLPRSTMEVHHSSPLGEKLEVNSSSDRDEL